MTSTHLIGNGKINQQGTLLMLDKVEQLRNLFIKDLKPGVYEETSGLFELKWRVKENTPYAGTAQVTVRINYTPASLGIAESIFYRSE